MDTATAAGRQHVERVHGVRVDGPRAALNRHRDLVDALSRDHLVDHPDGLVAWMAGANPNKEGS
jgi:hypothetical protein